MPTAGSAGEWLCGGPSIKPLTKGRYVKGAGAVAETSMPTTKQGALLGQRMLNREQNIALAMLTTSLGGLAPITRQSGNWKGKSRIQGGRALRAAGKPAKVAIVAIVRKLLIIANALLRDQRMWAPDLAMSPVYDCFGTAPSPPAR